MATTQIVKWGNSLAVRIPKPVAKEAGVSEGDPIIIEAEKGSIRVRQPSVPSLRELVSKITAENRYEALESGPDRDKEQVEW
jgi:antitoxin MazE